MVDFKKRAFKLKHVEVSLSQPLKIDSLNVL